MKILFCLSSLHEGGAERVVSILANKLSESNEIILLKIAESSKDSFYSISNRVKVVSLYTRTKVSHGFNRLLKLRKFFKEECPDVIVSFLPEVIIYTRFASLLMKIPFICSERNDPNQYNIIKKILLKIAFKSSSACVYQTQDACNWYRTKRNKSFVIYNPVLIDSNYKIKNRKNVVLFIGKKSDQKNINLAIRAFKLFRSKYKEYEMHIYGNGYAKRQLSKDGIFFYNSNPQWILNEFNDKLFLLTSKFEGMPNALLECASLGINCIASDCPIGGCYEISKYYNNVHLFPIDSDANYISALMELHKNDSYKPKISKKFQIDTIVKQWLLVITNIVK